MDKPAKTKKNQDAMFFFYEHILRPPQEVHEIPRRSGGV